MGQPPDTSAHRPTGKAAKTVRLDVTDQPDGDVMNRAITPILMGQHVAPDTEHLEGKGCMRVKKLIVVDRDFQNRKSCGPDTKVPFFS